jgi:hypothetical protein
MGESTDYDAVNVLDGKPREEYSYVERRVEILDRIERAGHPDVLNKSQLAREHGVSHTSIGWDFDALAESVTENLDCDHSFVMDRVLRGAVRNLVEDGEHYKTMKAAEMWYDFLADVGEVTRAPERRELDMEATVAHEQTETEDCVLITDEDKVLGDGDP